MLILNMIFERLKTSCTFIGKHQGPGLSRTLTQTPLEVHFNQEKPKQHGSREDEIQIVGVYVRSLNNATDLCSFESPPSKDKSLEFQDE